MTELNCLAAESQLFRSQPTGLILPSGDIKISIKKNRQHGKRENVNAPVHRLREDTRTQQELFESRSIKPLSAGGRVGDIVVACNDRRDPESIQRALQARDMVRCVEILRPLSPEDPLPGAGMQPGSRP